MTTRQQRLAGIAADQTLFKQFATEVEALEERRAKFTITTSNPDRERDIVDAAGIETDAYMRNPVIQFAHDYKSLPIGRTVKLERHKDRIVATAEFATADLNPMAEQVFRMVKAGFVKGASIGFRPLEWNYDEMRRGVNFQKVELLEWSVVPVPANASALIAAGIQTGVLKEWAERTLAACAGCGSDADDVVLELVDEPADDDPIPVRRSELEAAIRRTIQPIVERLRAVVRERQTDDELALILADRPEDTIEIAEDDLRALPQAIGATLRQTMAPLIQAETRRAINALRGRID